MENKNLISDSESLGATLRRGRELRAISLEEVASATHVRMNYLHAIEQNQLDLLPGLVFLKGYVRAYANYIGLNLEDTMVLLEDYTAARTEQPSQVLKRQFIYPLLALFIVAFVFALIWFLKS